MVKTTVGASIMKRRHGFTLVELLVSMALIIFIMAILSQAFQAALGTFRNLKAQGDMAEKLRGVTQLLQRDLAADHFNGKKRLSDPDFWLNGPPSQGFFRIWQSGPSPSTTAEGLDLDGIGSYISTNHYLAFTVKKRGNEMGDFFSASAPPAFLTASANFGPAEARYQGTSGGAYNYQWAEVAWFLQPQINPTTLLPDTTAPDPTVINPATGSPPFPGVPLYTLYRRQRLLVPDNSLVSAGSGGGIPVALASGCLELSCWANGTNLYFNSPMDITVPWRRFGMVPLSTYPEGLLYATSTFPPLLPWPQTPAWVQPTLTPPVPLPTYPPSGVAPYYPTLAQQSTMGTLLGADMQLNDVISFDVRVLIINPATGLPEATNGNDPFVTLFHPAFTLTPAEGLAQTPPITSYNNSNQAFYTQDNAVINPNAPAVFDTWSSLNDGLSNYSAWNVNGLLNPVSPYTSIPLWNGIKGPTIQAIQITIRIWDFKTNQSRQVTIVQAM
jgi:prepilin-type N-terminal cleavage/methylation domain-containing protein